MVRLHEALAGPALAAVEHGANVRSEELENTYFAWLRISATGASAASFGGDTAFLRGTAQIAGTSP